MKIKNLLNNEITQEDILNYYNVTLLYEKMPHPIYGFVFNYDGVNFIIINKYKTLFKQTKTILHELAHIELSHLNQIDKDLFAFKINTYEDEADKYLKQLLNSKE